MQVVSEKFKKAFNADVVPLDWGAKISLNRKRNERVGWFKLNRSQLNGADILTTPENNPAQYWDAFEYLDISDRLMEMSYERKVDFPHNVQASVADIKLNNYDEKMSVLSGSEWSDQILPNRPLRLYLGAKNAENLPVFVGTTEKMPEYSEDRTLNWTALDFLAEIGESKLKNTIMMLDTPTDILLSEIFKQYGMSENQFKLSKGQNVVPFAYFKSGDNVGNILKKLVEAENGFLWLDEQGVIRFENRSGNVGKSPVMTFDENNIIRFASESDDGVINQVKIKSEVRKKQPLQVIFSTEGREEWTVKPNRNLEIWLSLENPAVSVLPLKVGKPENGEQMSWVSFKKGEKEDNSGITAKGELFADSYKLTVKNAGKTDSRIEKIELWGEAVVVVDTIDYEAFDRESLVKYGKRELEITDNNYFGTYKNCDLFAVDVLKKYAKYSPTVKMTVNCSPALQLGDVVSLDYGARSGDYLITGISTKLSRSNFETEITAKPHQTVRGFTLNKSQLNGKEVLI